MRLIFFLLLFLFCFSCNNSSESIASLNQCRVDVLFSPSGFGDRAYNDVVLYGIERLHKKHGFELIIHLPDNVDEGWNNYERWCRDSLGKGRQLFIFASNEYEDRLRNHIPVLDAQKNVMLFQADKGIDNVCVFDLETYGAAYFIGKLIGDSYMTTSAAMLLANCEDKSLKACESGFREGFLDNKFESNYETYYLAKKSGDGYNMPDSAFKVCSTIFQRNRFVFPVAGGSNVGVYRYLRENGRGVYAVGMDAEMSNYSDMIVASLVKRFDLVLEQYIDSWVNGEDLVGFTSYGLESGFVYVEISDYYDEFFSPYVKGIQEKSIKKEHEYLEKK